jgi:putative flippase GtrA
MAAKRSCFNWPQVGVSKIAEDRNMPKTKNIEMLSRTERQGLLNGRVLKYGVVGCTGIAVNLGTMALFLTLGFKQGWAPSAIASVVSTSGNFILHNRWTFSDRQHQGLHLVRGFLSFAIISAVAVSMTTAFYIVFSRIATHLTIVNSRLAGLGIPLSCQFAAILLAASTSYLLNGQFTWPKANSNAAAKLAEVQEICD